MKKSKRLVADIPEELHKEIKIQAMLRNITVRKYVMRAIIEKLNYDTQHEKNSK